jgi:hypothetical protein
MEIFELERILGQVEQQYDGKLEENKNYKNQISLLNHCIGSKKI